MPMFRTRLYIRTYNISIFESDNVSRFINTSVALSYLFLKLYICLLSMVRIVRAFVSVKGVRRYIYLHVSVN